MLVILLKTNGPNKHLSKEEKDEFVVKTDQWRRTDFTNVCGEAWRILEPSAVETPHPGEWPISWHISDHEAQHRTSWRSAEGEIVDESATDDNSHAGFRWKFGNRIATWWLNLQRPNFWATACQPAVSQRPDFVFCLFFSIFWCWPKWPRDSEPSENFPFPCGRFLVFVNEMAPLTNIPWKERDPCRRGWSQGCKDSVCQKRSFGGSSHVRSPWSWRFRGKVRIHAVWGNADDRK
jgi:hypothetical protein